MKQRIDTQTCAVVIPIYRKPTLTERISLASLKRYLGNYDLFLAKPEHLNFSLPGFKEKIFDDYWFKSIKNYAGLMVSASFYNSYLEYEYILIYQLDCLVFSDSLLFWCNQNYDYIGAPFFKGCNEGVWPDSDLVGNGGFSLRRVESHLRIIQIVNQSPKLESSLKKKINDFSAEDVFFGVDASAIDPSFKVPCVTEAIKFGFNSDPHPFWDRYQSLPFGAHAWPAYADEYRKYLTGSSLSENLDLFLLDFHINKQKMISRLKRILLLATKRE